MITIFTYQMTMYQNHTESFASVQLLQCLLSECQSSSHVGNKKSCLTAPPVKQRDNIYKSIISQNQTFARVISLPSSSLQHRLPTVKLCHCKLLDGMPSIHRKEGEHMRQLMEVENPMVLGTIQAVNSVPTFRYIETEFRDLYGSLIVFNDDYMEFPNGDIVHLDNIHTYLEDNYNAKFYTKK